MWKHKKAQYFICENSWPISIFTLPFSLSLSLFLSLSLTLSLSLSLSIYFPPLSPLSTYVFFFSLRLSLIDLAGSERGADTQCNNRQVCNSQNSSCHLIILYFRCKNVSSASIQTTVPFHTFFFSL